MSERPAIVFDHVKGEVRHAPYGYHHGGIVPSVHVGYPVPQPQVQASKLRPGDTIDGQRIVRIEQPPEGEPLLFHLEGRDQPRPFATDQIVKGARRRPQNTATDPAEQD